MNARKLAAALRLVADALEEGAESLELEASIRQCSALNAEEERKYP